MVSGLAPGKDADTEMVGKSTCGSGATGSSGKTTRPTRKMPPINSEVAIGRRTNGSEMLMMLSDSPRRSAMRGGMRTCTPGLQPVLIARDDAFIQGDALCDDRHAAAFRAELQGPHFHRGIALDDVGKGSIRTELHRRGRQRQHVALGAHQHACIDVLAGPERIVRVVEGGFELRGAGGLIDFIVDQRQRALIEYRYCRRATVS